jgi:hypothetical protein
MCRALIAVSLLLASLALTPAAGAQDAQPSDESHLDQGQTGDSAVPDCAADLDCFIAYAEGCWPAVVTWRPSVEVLGIHWYSTTRLEIRELLDDQCMVQVRLESLDARYSAELVLDAIAAGASSEEVQTAELETSQQAQTYAGTESTCAFPSTLLPVMLERWKVSGFTALDWALLQCS